MQYYVFTPLPFAESLWVNPCPYRIVIIFKPCPCRPVPTICVTLAHAGSIWFNPCPCRVVVIFRHCPCRPVPTIYVTLVHSGFVMLFNLCCDLTLAHAGLMYNHVSTPFWLVSFAGSLTRLTFYDQHPQLFSFRSAYLIWKISAKHTMLVMFQSLINCDMKPYPCSVLLCFHPSPCSDFMIEPLPTQGWRSHVLSTIFSWFWFAVSSTNVLYRYHSQH